MADINVIEIKELRKRRLFLELIKNTSACCLNWVRISINQNQFKSTKDNFEFILSATGADITLDVIKDCKLISSYKSSENEDIQNLYNTVVLIQDKQFFIVADEEKELIETLQWCRCINTWNEYFKGGVVIGGSAMVYQPQRIFEIMEGGIITDGNSPESVIGPELIIGPDTYIYIWFDSSGSMNSTLDPLITMKNTLLKDALLSFYNNESATYDNHVFVQNYQHERTMDVIMRSANTLSPSTPPNTLLPDYQFPVEASNIIVLWFQDESTPYNDFITRNSTYQADIGALRTRIETFPLSFYRSVFFQVDFANDDFKTGLQKIETSTAPFNGIYGLSDKNEFGFKYNITDGGTAEYYLEEILSALEELGFEVR